MQRILLNTEAAKEANKKAVRGLEENQKLIESQKMVIEVLKKHKNDLDELQHLKDIDWFYDEYQDFKASQEDAFDEVYASQELVADEILHLQEKQTTTTQQLTNLDDEYQDFKASQEKHLVSYILLKSLWLDNFQHSKRNTTEFRKCKLKVLQKLSVFKKKLVKRFSIYQSD